MTNKSVLIIGSTGLLAFDLIRAFKESYKVIEASHRDFNVADEQAVLRFIKLYNPDIVINTAVFLPVDECEKDPRKSFEVNAIGAFYVAKAAKAVGALNVYISTNYVFDGNKHSYSEDDVSNPINVYGASKLAGEILTKIIGGDYYIIRTGWLYGIRRRDSFFIAQVINSAKKREPIKLVNNQYGTPTYTLDLAHKIKELIDKKAPNGVYHITNSGSCSWYMFAEKVLELCGMSAELVAIGLKEKCSVAKKPLFSVLMNKNIGCIGIKELRPWDEALNDYLEEAKY